jgi:hypothetical protein
MIGKATTGKGFSGLASYLEHGDKGQSAERVAWSSGENLPTNAPSTASRIMSATANDNARTQKPVYHLSLSWDHGDQVDKEAMLEQSREVLKDLGLEKHQALILAHNDTDHSHVHIMVNRVDPETGKAWSNSHDYTRIEASLRRIEVERGLRQVPGHHHRLKGQEAPDRADGFSTGELRRAQRTNQKPFAELVKDAAPHFDQVKTWGQLHKELAEEGLHLIKSGRGLSISDGDEAVKASSVTRKASLSALERRLGKYEPERAIGPTRGADRRPDDEERSRHGRDAERTYGHGERGDERGPSDPRGREPHTAGAAEKPDLMGRDPDHPEPGQRVDRGHGGGRNGVEHSPDRSGLPSDLRDALGRLDAAKATYERHKELVAERDEARKASQKWERKTHWSAGLQKRTNQQWNAVFRHPEKAVSHFERLTAKHGHNRAAWVLNKNPKEFGALKGVDLTVWRSQGRREALAALQDMPRELKRARGASMAVSRDAGNALTAKERAEAVNRQIDAQKPLSRDQSRQLHQTIAKTAKGLSDAQWRGMAQPDRNTVTQARTLQSRSRDQSRSRGPER